MKKKSAKAKKGPKWESTSWCCPCKGTGGGGFVVIDAMRDATGAIAWFVVRLRRHALSRLTEKFEYESWQSVRREEWTPPEEFRFGSLDEAKAAAERWMKSPQPIYRENRKNE